MRWEYQTTLPASWESCMQDKEQQSELNKNNEPVQNSQRSIIKAVYCHPAHLAYLQSTSCEMPG